MTATLKTDQQEHMVSAEARLQVWNKAEKIPGFNEKLWRRDKNGMIIQYTEYHNPESVYGWHIESITTDEKETNRDHHLQALNMIRIPKSSVSIFPDIFHS